MGNWRPKNWVEVKARLLHAAKWQQLYDGELIELTVDRMLEAQKVVGVHCPGNCDKVQDCRECIELIAGGEAGTLLFIPDSVPIKGRKGEATITGTPKRTVLIPKKAGTKPRSKVRKAVREIKEKNCLLLTNNIGQEVIGKDRE